MPLPFAKNVPCLWYIDETKGRNRRATANRQVKMPRGYRFTGFAKSRFGSDACVVLRKGNRLGLILRQYSDVWKSVYEGPFKFVVPELMHVDFVWSLLASRLRVVAFVWCRNQEKPGVRDHASGFGDKFRPINEVLDDLKCGGNQIKGAVRGAGIKPSRPRA